MPWRKSKFPRSRLEVDLEAVKKVGRELDWRPNWLGGKSWREGLISAFLCIRDKQGLVAPLAPNRAQAEFAAHCTRRNIVLKARQVGITTYVAARFFVQTVFRPGTLTVQVAHDQRSAEEIFRVVHRYLENLPEWLRAGVLATSHANVRQLVFPYIDSEYRIETAADPHAGRGLTIQNLHCSEVARWPRDAAATLAGLRAAVPAQGEIVLESTPNGASGCFYDEWQRAPGTGYTRHFFPWWWEPNYEIAGRNVLPLSDDEQELVRQFGLSEAQIAYRRQLRADFGALARQEYAEDADSCFLASGECVFDLHAIERRMAQCSHPVEARDNGRLLIWWPPQAGRQYLIGVDPAGGGVDGDYACAQVIEREGGLQCAELHGHFTPQELASRVAGLGTEYGTALLVIERNNHGHAVLAHLQASEKYSRVYRQRGQPGWLTTFANRPRILERLAVMLAEEPALFGSRRLLAECRTFVRRADGSPAAASGAHDDCIMAMALAQAARAEMGDSNDQEGIEMASLTR